MTKQRSLVRRLLSPAIRRGTGLARDEQGAVAVEFAILAPFFFAVILAIIETSMTFFAQQVLESALQDTTRLIRTGQSQSDTPWTTEDFRKQLCGRAFGFLACSATNGATDRLWVKVTPIDTFSGATNAIARPIGNNCSLASSNPTVDCKWSIDEEFNDGAGSSVIIAQAFYKWPTLFNVPWFNLADQAGNNRLLSAVRVFKNEPFGGAPAGTP